MADMPRARYPASTQDVLNYLGRLVANQQLYYVVAFAGRLDAERLARALRLALDAEPVLGCCFVPRSPRPYWERRDDLGDLPFCTVTETGAAAKELQQFAVRPADPCTDPLVEARILRGDVDTLCLRVDHVVADAAGARDLLYAVAGLYRALDDPAYRPLVRAPGSRGLGQVVRRVGRDAAHRALRGLRPLPAQEWGFPSTNRSDTSERCFAVRRVEPAPLAAIAAPGKASGATLNDLLLAAYFRALFAIIHPEPQLRCAVMVTVDLRRYLPGGAMRAIGNLSGAVFPTLQSIPDEPFEATLRRVVVAMRALKADMPGLGSALFAARSLKAGFAQLQRGIAAGNHLDIQSGRANPILTNFGAIDPDRLAFGVPVTDAYALSPIAFAPKLMLGLTTFRGALTFTVGFCACATSSADVAHLLDLIVNELMNQQ